jgi:rhamnosyltransferase
VLVLMSTYNGVDYLAEQVESIRRQTYTGWDLLVRDDGSTDGTVALLDRMAAADTRIVRLVDDAGNLGPAQSFGVLMQAALTRDATYIAFADQDDVWDADKLAVQLEAMAERERTAGADAPILVHTDLRVVDERLRLIHPSFLTFQGLGTDGHPLRQLLTQNFVTGCSTLVNRPLLRLALPLPAVVMHDWWLALCAAAQGEVVRVPKTTALYRQHARNAAGSRGRVRAALGALRRPGRWWRQTSRAFRETVAQARALDSRLSAAKGDGQPAQNAECAEHAETRAVVRAYCQAFSPDTGRLERLRLIRHHGVRPRSAVRYPALSYARVALWSPGPGDGRDAP